MKAVLFILFVSTLHSTVLAQIPRKAIMWSSDPGCGFRTKAITPDDRVSCSSVETERGPVSTISYNGITLSAVFLDDDAFVIVAAQIVNDTAEPIAFDGDRWGAAHYRTKTDFVSHLAPIIAETSIPTRDLIRSMAAGTRLENSLGDFMGESTMTAETKEVRKADGTRYRVTVIVPDKDVQASQQSQNAARSQVLTAEQLRIRANALTAKSVPAGSAVKGLVYFRRVKKAEFVVFSFKIEDTAFIYALPRTKKS